MTRVAVITLGECIFMGIVLLVAGLLGMNRNPVEYAALHPRLGDGEPAKVKEDYTVAVVLILLRESGLVVSSNAGGELVVVSN